MFADEVSFAVVERPYFILESNVLKDFEQAKGLLESSVDKLFLPVDGVAIVNESRCKEYDDIGFVNLFEHSRFRLELDGK